MTLERWDPLRDLLSLQERMNRLFEESLAREHREGTELPAAWVPPADVVETGAAYVVELELPGLSRDDVEVHAEAHELVVRGRRRAAWEARPERFHRLERSYGAFQRLFHFEHEIAAQRVAADLRDGLLRVELPKSRTKTKSTVDSPRSTADCGSSGASRRAGWRLNTRTQSTVDSRQSTVRPAA